MIVCTLKCVSGAIWTYLELSGESTSDLLRQGALVGSRSISGRMTSCVIDGVGPGLGWVQSLVPDRDAWSILFRQADR